MMNVSLRQIEIFLAVARTLSFSQAAELCHLSQPALSGNIKRLEDTIGARLFERHTRKVALTPVGEAFRELAGGLTENVQQVLLRTQDFVAGRRGRLVVAAAPSMASKFAPTVIAAFTRQHPDIEIELHDALSDICLDMVASGTADVALAAHKPQAGHLEQTALFRDHLAVIYPAGHPLGALAKVRWRDVQPYPHIVMNPSSGVRQLIDAQYARYGLRMRPAFEVAQVSTLLGLIEAGLGVGELPESLIQNVETAGLEHRRIASPAGYRILCASTIARRSLAPAVAPFVALCLAQADAAAQAGLTAGTQSPTPER